MTRPQTVQDMFESLDRDRLVESARLRAFIDRHKPTDVNAALERLVTEGLLTAFQASEVGAGRGNGLWFGSYRVLDRVGKGGMGHVYLAEHSVLGRKVAVKALSDALRADPVARKRFVREARAAAALDHPNIVRVFDVNMTHDPPYLVMEYVDGLSLQAAVSRAGTFSVGEAAAVGVQAADGLAQAAAVGLVHRDIKPANLLVDRRGALKILDLGIVRFTHDDTHSRIHGAEVILGTVDYLAPEQAEDSSKVDTRADIYALGATLYFLIAGHPPYPMPDLRQKLEAKQEEDPPALHQLRPDVPPEFAAVVARMMARDPAERYPLPATAIAALHPWASPGPDFPGRLFRLSSDTTVPGRRQDAHEQGHDPLPDTLRIIKPLARRATDKPSGTVANEERAEAPPPPTPAAGSALAVPSLPVPPTHEVLADLELDTPCVAGGAALTDEVRALPADLWTAPEPPTGEAPVVPARSGFSARTAIGLILAVLALAGGVAALVAFAGQ
jgi:eukaryotic-like serine/threonine-protein kinase